MAHLINYIILNNSKKKDTIVDLQKFRARLHPVKVCGLDIEVVTKSKYLVLPLDSKLDWPLNTDKLYKKGESRLFLLILHSS